MSKNILGLITKVVCCMATALLLTTSALAAEEGKAVQTQAPSAHFPELNYKFKSEVEGVKITADFIIQNKGKEVLKINEVKTG